MENEELKKRFKAPCPISLLMVAYGKLDSPHSADYSITSRDTLYFNCVKCDSRGWVNAIDPMKAILENKEQSS